MRTFSLTDYGRGGTTVERVPTENFFSDHSRCAPGNRASLAAGFLRGQLIKDRESLAGLSGLVPVGVLTLIQGDDSQDLFKRGLAIDDAAQTRLPQCAHSLLNCDLLE